jgi:2-C-methyl-D-erythritol 4-phosphate cytidylyltransferase
MRALASRFWVVIPAAGSGRRMRMAMPKQFLRVEGRTILRHTLDCFLEHPRIAGITVAMSADAKAMDLDLPDVSATFRIVAGGAERADSVGNALDSLEPILTHDDWVLVHDAARPCLPSEDLECLLDFLQDDAVGGLLATPSTDTLKWVDDDGRVRRTLDRSRVWRAMTPQMFRFGLLRQALQEASGKGIAITDEASAIELFGLRPKIIEGSPVNIKVTRPEDIEIVRAYLAQQQKRQESR